VSKCNSQEPVGQTSKVCPLLLFVRHGESEANILHQISNRGFRHGLTASGRRQAALLATKLQSLSPGRLFSSPLRRAVETSQILSEALAVPYAITDALREYDCGSLEGRSDAEAWREYERLSHRWMHGQEWTARLPEGESFLQVQERFVPFVERLARSESGSGDPIVLVGHGGLYHFMLPLILANIDLPFAVEHPVGYTGVVEARMKENGLVCASWCGAILETADGRG
jgi:broad specificity phosphatase PhoE